MKQFKVIAIGGFILTSFLCCAQEDYAFRVLANKGTNEVKSGNTWQPLKTGAQLKTSDELKISENASVGLVSKSGRPLEVREAKVHKVVDLLSKVGNNQSVLNKYTDFILSSNSAESKKNRLSATGAVHRGLEDIKVFLPEDNSNEVFNNTVIVSWQSSKSSGPFIVTVTTLFEDELMKIETPETKVQLDLSDPKFMNFPTLQIDVKSKSDGRSRAQQHSIKRPDPSRYEAIKVELGKAEDLKEETAFNKYLLAGFYEENRLLIDAIACYEQAIKMDPENPTYTEGYEEFLLRNKLKAIK
ncbi:MAG TPA: hypothetical protein VL728_13880 [Cyclobacteriaceae bacterium]|nr:hypothetical protein [Cyclobacteriaceae bacterium]